MKSRDFIERRGRRFPVQHHRDMESILEGSWKRGQSSFPFPKQRKTLQKNKKEKKKKRWEKTNRKNKYQLMPGVGRGVLLKQNVA